LITVCAKYRRKILANPTAHALLREALQTYNDFSVGRYVILPDHIHLFVGDSEGLAYARPPDDPLRTGVAGSLFNPSLTITERLVISGQ